MRRIFMSLVAIMLSACGMTSTPTPNAIVEACREIEDETLRVVCLSDIGHSWQEHKSSENGGEQAETVEEQVENVEEQVESDEP